MAGNALLAYRNYFFGMCAFLLIEHCWWISKRNVTKMSNNVREIRLLEKLWKNRKMYCMSVGISREYRKMSEGYLGAFAYLDSIFVNFVEYY